MEDKFTRILEAELAAQDDEFQKQSRIKIRRESFQNQDPAKRASVLQRLEHNEAIVNATVRVAQRKATRQSCLNLDEIAHSQDTCATFTNQVKKIEDYAQNKYNELKEQEERLQRKSKAPNFMNRKQQKGKIIARMLTTQSGFLKTRDDKARLFNVNKQS